MAARKNAMVRVKYVTFVGVKCRRMKPTLKHRPVLWENMWGTVYAMSPTGEVKYFDCDTKAALRFARVSTQGADNRVHRIDFYTLQRVRTNRRNSESPSAGQLVLWAPAT